MKKAITLTIFILCFITVKTKSNNILEQFLHKYTSFEYLRYNITIIDNLNSPTPNIETATCKFKFSGTGSFRDYSFNFNDKKSKYVFNGKEFMQYSPSIYGDSVVNMISFVHNPELFKADTIKIDNQIMLSTPVYQNTSYFRNSLVYLISFIKTLDLNRLQEKDTVVDGKDAIIYRYHAIDTIVNQERNYYIYKFVIDKNTKLLLSFINEYYLPMYGQYFISNSVKSQVIYNNYNFDKMNDEDIFTIRAFDPTFRIVENANFINDKKLLDRGVPAPEFDLNSIRGYSYKMSNSNQKVRLLVFSSINCAPCQLATPKLNELQIEYPEVEIIAIYPLDDKLSLEKYINKHKVVYPIIASNKDFAEKYNISGYPTFYIIDQNGIIKYSQAGYGEGTKKILKDEIMKLTKRK